MSRRTLYTALSQADGKCIRRLAPMEFIGRYEPGSFCTPLDDSTSRNARSSRSDLSETVIAELLITRERLVIVTGRAWEGSAGPAVPGPAPDWLELFGCEPLEVELQGELELAGHGYTGQMMACHWSGRKTQAVSRNRFFSRIRASALASRV